MADREKWDKKYDARELLHGPQASEFLRANASLLPRRGLALDIAAGEGRNSVFLAELGLDVIALDISVRAIEKCLLLSHDRGVRVNAAAVDLSEFPIPPRHFDVIVNFNYLNRQLSPSIIEGLKTGGLLVFETLTIDHRRWKPEFNPDFLLRRGELAEMFRRLHLLKYREADLEIITTEQTSHRSVASLIARK